MSACCHCRAVIQSYALPTLPWGPGVQTLWHTAVSCSRSFSVRLSPHACWDRLDPWDGFQNHLPLPRVQAQTCPLGALH